MNGYNFTERFRSVLGRAREEVAHRGHHYVEPEHILIRLLDDDGVGTVALETLTGDNHQLRGQLDAALAALVHDAPSTPDLPYSLRSKRVLEWSMAAASSLDHPYVGTEHLCIGLLHDEQILSTPLLLARGVTAASARAEVIRLVGRHSDAGATS